MFSSVKLSVNRKLRRILDTCRRKNDVSFDVTQAIVGNGNIWRFLEGCPFKVKITTFYSERILLNLCVFNGEKIDVLEKCWPVGNKKNANRSFNKNATQSLLLRHFFIEKIDFIQDQINLNQAASTFYKALHVI